MNRKPFFLALSALLGALAMATSPAQAAPARSASPKVATVAPAAASPAAPAAPSPTPEMAQGFLKTIIAQGGTELYLGDIQWLRTPPLGRYFQGCSTDCPAQKSTTGHVLGAASSAICNTTFTVAVKSEDLNDIDINTGVNHGRIYTRPAQFQHNVGTNWAKVTKVSQWKEGVTLVGFRYTTDDVRLTFPTEELAQRVARAMEVLRRHCDPTTSYGF